jgi:cell division protein FtsZ
MLADTHSVVVHVAGGPDLTLNEVSVLMEEFNRHVSDTTRVHFGVSTDQSLGRRLTVTIFSSAGATAAAAAPVARPAVVRQPAPVIREEPLPLAIEIADSAADEDEDIIPHREPEPVPVLLPKTKSITPPQGQPPLRKATPEKTAVAAKKEEKAEQMQLEPVNRGRFEKAEPTIVDGQDFDVPTFMRKNLTLK